MTEHHGLDLVAIEAASGGHSIFAPSGSYMWLTCSHSLLANLLLPDNAGAEAAEGTVGHEVGEKWLKKCHQVRKLGRPHIEDVQELVEYCRPNDMVGKVKKIVERTATFEIKITDEMLTYVGQYVLWCMELPGNHYVEERVDFSQLTPIPKQGGTADHAACSPGLLVITDLKYGKGIRVSAAEYLDDPRAFVGYKFNGNPQAMLYALGFFFAYDVVYHFERIVIRIAQPRMDVFETWETTREELLAFSRYVKLRAADAWKPNSNMTPSDKGCVWCKKQATCIGWAAWREDAVDGVFDDVSDVIQGQYKDITEERAVAVQARLDATGPSQAMPDPTNLTTAQMAKLLPMRKAMERFFSRIEEELQYRADNGEAIPDHKMVDGREGDREWADDTFSLTTTADQLRFLGVPEEKLYVRKLLTPAQAEEVIRTTYKLSKRKAGELISRWITRTPGTPTLVALSDKRPPRDDVGEVFDSVEEEI